MCGVAIDPEMCIRDRFDNVGVVAAHFGTRDPNGMQKSWQGLKDLTVLKQLETSLGIQLFERKGRRMILTFAGEEFVKSARDITMKCFEVTFGSFRFFYKFIN